MYAEEVESPDEPILSNTPVLAREVRGITNPEAKVAQAPEAASPQTLPFVYVAFVLLAWLAFVTPAPAARAAASASSDEHIRKGKLQQECFFLFWVAAWTTSSGW